MVRKTWTLALMSVALLFMLFGSFSCGWFSDDEDDDEPEGKLFFCLDAAERYQAYCQESIFADSNCEETFKTLDCRRQYEHDVYHCERVFGSKKRASVFDCLAEVSDAEYECVGQKGGDCDECYEDYDFETPKETCWGKDSFIWE